MAASPPRLSYEAFRNSDKREVFLESLQKAEDLVAGGRPDGLFVTRFPFPLLISAASFLDKYGPNENYDLLKFVGRVRPRTLLVYGELELRDGGVAFADLPAQIRSALKPEQPLEIATVPAADHFYSGVYNQLCDTMMPWLEG